MSAARDQEEAATAVTPAVRIVVEWGDGTVGHFERQSDGSWHQAIEGMRVTGYDGPNVMRVLANAVGTTEIADGEVRPRAESEVPS